jgi:hypothetical protein
MCVRAGIYDRASAGHGSGVRAVSGVCSLHAFLCYAPYWSRGLSACQQVYIARVLARASKAVLMRRKVTC